MFDKVRFFAFSSTVCVLSLVLVLGIANAGNKIETILDMNPVGYWPANDGNGDVLRDYSGNNNDGEIFQVPWKDGLLDFTGAYQFIEIPSAEQYQTRNFSIGGWVFVRDEVFGGLYPGWAGMTFFGNGYHHSGYTLDTLYDETCLFLKSKWLVAGGDEAGISLCVRKEQKVDVISGGKDEALAAKKDSPAIEIGKWQHILYTYKADAELEGGNKWKQLQSSTKFYGAGTAKLYINGKLAITKNNVAYKPRDMRFLIGSDAVWWLQSDKSGSLDGSVSDMVIFDRTLDESEIGKLCKASMPSSEPVVYNSYDLVLGGKQIALSQLASLPKHRLEEALRTLNGTSSEDLSEIDDELVAALSKMGIDINCCDLVAKLLAKINTPASKIALNNLLVDCSNVLRDSSLPQEQKVNVILAMTAAGKFSEADVTVLVDMLEEMKLQGVHIPRVEDKLRNSIIAALLKFQSKNENIRKLLGEVYAKPILDEVDMSKVSLVDVSSLYKQRRFMDALDVYRKLPLKDNDEYFFSQGDKYRDRRDWKPNSRAYTATAEYNGCVYKAGEGESWKGVEALSQDDFVRIMEEMSLKYPKARTWRNVGAPNLCRATVTKIDPDGTEQKIYLGGESFVFDGTDMKLRGWSIAVDTDGYIHIIGGMHNAPVSSNYMPGTWDMVGISEDFTSDDYPKGMYWVSSKPGSIDSFEFVGQRSSPRCMPMAMGLNYINFIQDNNGKLYIYGRVYIQGVQSWGLYSYDTASKRWSSVGGYAPDVKSEYPQWTNYLTEFAADWIDLCTIRWRNDLPQTKTLAWARQPHFYSYIRGWGIRFDKDNRMYISASLFGLNADNVNVNSKFFAYSDDGGQSFHRADGSDVMLPLTVNPVDEKNANTNYNSGYKWIELWQSLFSYAGYDKIR